MDKIDSGYRYFATFVTVFLLGSLVALIGYFAGSHLTADVGLTAIIASMVGVIFIPVLGGIASLIVSSSRGRLDD